MKDLRLQQFITATFGEEGSFQNNPKDKGNYYNGILYGTIWGITARDHFEVFTKAKALYDEGKIKESKSFARDFYTLSEYWNLLYNIINDSSLAFRIWDFGINAGYKTAVKLFQEVVKKNYEKSLKVDGVFGAKSLLAANKYSHPHVRFYLKNREMIPGETEFYTLYVKRLQKHYRSLKNFWYWGDGWLHRVKRIFNGVPDLYDQVLLPKP